MSRAQVFGVTSRSSASPQASQVHVSHFAPSLPMDRWALVPVRRIAGSPHAGQCSPAFFGVAASSFARRASIASIRSGASLIRFHEGQRSNAERMSERNDNVVS